MRRLISLCCLSLLLLTLCGRALFFELRLAEIRAGMRQSLAEGGKTDLAEHFTFSTGTQPQWRDDSTEFDWAGNRYDVLTLRRQGTTIDVQAVSDTKETALVAGFRQQERREGTAPASVLLLKLAAQSYVPTELPALPPARSSALPATGDRYRFPSTGVYSEQPGRPPRSDLFSV